MGLRITTWNVNGIRNPFQYQPWRGEKTFGSMFDILEADIVIFQETKIQRKDLRDDMVLIQGWDSFWSLPKHKKGYSGVVIYTRQSVCAPIRAEEGITGILCPPNSSTSFSDLPGDQQIGGYPTPAQLASSLVDAATIDSEGRCVILEFPAFVLLGVYSPANRDESRDDFRIGFLSLLDARIRNLISLKKRVVLVGDLNISRDELDTANAEVSMSKSGLTREDYISTPSRRLFNQLLEDGKVLGERDARRENPVMWDICRAFHPTRKGMFTCWEQKTNARPGNFGARIDYVLCSLSMKSWCFESNIQEGLMGSDHCPVYVILNDKIDIDGVQVDLLDMMNPTEMFMFGHRQRDHSIKDCLPLSGKLIPEFDGRRSIRDMFSRKVSLTQSHQSSLNKDPGFSNTVSETLNSTKKPTRAGSTGSADASSIITCPTFRPSQLCKKRPITDHSSHRPLKRDKLSVMTSANTISKNQQSLSSFLTPKASPSSLRSLETIPRTMITSQANLDKLHSDLPPLAPAEMDRRYQTPYRRSQEAMTDSPPYDKLQPFTDSSNIGIFKSPTNSLSTSHKGNIEVEDRVHDPIEAKDSWSRVFAKPVFPRCEGHGEPCIRLLTKKSGLNCGRSFWMCQRPLGPTGSKEKNTQWRCQTFIWCSDWNSIRDFQ